MRLGGPGRRRLAIGQFAIRALLVDYMASRCRTVSNVGELVFFPPLAFYLLLVIKRKSRLAGCQRRFSFLSQNRGRVTAQNGRRFLGLPRPSDPGPSPGLLPGVLRARAGSLRGGSQRPGWPMGGADVQADAAPWRQKLRHRGSTFSLPLPRGSLFWGQ